MALVRDLYDNLALKTGFPIYTNDTDCPDINRFLLEMLSEALKSTIDNLYISNNVLERNDTIITIPNKNLYGIEGIIKNIQLENPEDSNPRSWNIPYNDSINPNTDNDYIGCPQSYVIKNGYLKLIPTPDKEYTIKVTVSTTDLVLADDDSSRQSITHINDSIAASDKFCDLVLLRAAELTAARCNNPISTIYGDLYESRVRSFIEHDYGSLEAERGYGSRAGNYDSSRGLINDEYDRRRGWFD